MTDWQTISSLATAGGTLVLAAATFMAIRSSNRSARLAEQALLAGMRPLLVPSRSDDPPFKVLWGDRHVARIGGGQALCEEQDGVIYLALGIRNLGSGMALLHGWHPMAMWATGAVGRTPLEAFRRLTIDLYVPAGGAGYWESAIREPDDPVREGILQRMAAREPFSIDVLYGDQEGGQRSVSRFTLWPGADDGWYCQAGRHWNVDRPDPR